MRKRTQSVYNVSFLLKNFKKNRLIKVKYQQDFDGQSVKFSTANSLCTKEVSTNKFTVTLPADNENLLTYSLHIIN
jgi:hypothetical protein